MNRASIFRRLRFQRSPWWILPGLLAIFFSLVGTTLPSSASSISVVGRSSHEASATARVHTPKLTTKYLIADNHTNTRKAIIASSVNSYYTHAKKQVIIPLPSQTHRIAYLAPKSITPMILHKTDDHHAIDASIDQTMVTHLFHKHALLRVLGPPPVFQGGQNVRYTIVVSNSSKAGPVLAGDPITINDPIPVGLTNLAVNASSDWTTSLSGTTSPATLTATYIGTYPVASGATLPAITITGTLTSDAVPSLSNTATVSTPNDGNPDNNSGTSTNPIRPQPDLAIMETVPTNTTFQVGHSADFTLSVSNVSTIGSVLTGSPITVTDTIPDGLTGLTVTANSDWTIVLNSTTSPTTLSATYVGTYPVAPGTTLSPIVLHGTLTTSAVPQLTNPATVSTPYDSNPTNDSTSVTILVQPQPDMTITETVPTDATFQVGHSATFTITASNLATAGPVLDGDPITVTSAIPTGLTGLTATANSDWTIVLASTTSPTTITATYVGTYPVDPDTILSPITLTGTLTTAAMPTLTNPVTVNTPNDSNLDNNTASVTIPVVAQPDMTIAETVPTDTPFQVGHSATFTITASDLATAGPVLDGDPITITSTIPTGLTDLTTNTNSDWTVVLDSTTSPTTMTATYVGTYPVDPGTVLSPIALTGTLTTAAMPTLTNPVTVSTPNDSNPDNNNASVTITVIPQPDMTITETVPTGVIFQVGHTVTFTITGSNVTDAGPVLDGDPITITSAIPAGLTGLTVGSSSSDWLISLDSINSPTTMTATYIGTYPVTPGTTLSPITLTGTLTPAAVPTLTNPVTVSTPNDSNPANDNASVTITVLPQPNLALLKTVQAVSQAQKGQVAPELQKGQQVDYTIAVSNVTAAGPVMAGSPITVTDNIPVGLTDLVAKADSTIWHITLSHTTSPATLTATYIGPYPVEQGTNLSPITLLGTLTGDVVQLTNLATVSTPNNDTAGKNKHTGTTTVAIPVDIALKKTHLGPDTFTIGQTVHYVLQVYSANKSETIPASSPIQVIDALPIGFGHVHVRGNGWRIALHHHGNRTIVTARYVGHYPITRGTWLSPIMISVRARGKAGRVVNTAVVIMPYDHDLSNNRSSDAIMLRVPSLPPTGSDPNPLPVQHHQRSQHSRAGAHITHRHNRHLHRNRGILAWQRRGLHYL